MVASEKDYAMSRWTYIAVDQHFRTRKNDNRMQHYRKHRGVKIRSSKGTAYTPSEMAGNTPIIAYKTYADSSTAIINLAYYYEYGTHRCNVMTDNQMEGGVYAYVDASTAIGKIDMQRKSDMNMVVGVIAGWVSKVEPKKGRLRLDPRSCK